MVIHQFNKLIRNKWVWGAFAVAISAFFAFDFLIDDIGRDRGPTAGTAGKLGGEDVEADKFSSLAEDLRGFGRNRDWQQKSSEINRQAWEILAALEVAERNGLAVSDAAVREAVMRDRSFQQNGAFSFALYKALLRENGVTPERFEAFVRRRMTLARLGEAMIGSAAWVSPMELDRAVADMTDSFTVRVARFTQSKADAEKVKLDDAGLRKWYDANTNSLYLGERVKLRMVKFDATDEKTLKKMVVTEDEIKDHYDATVDRYTSTGTNGVETVKPFKDVRAQVEKEVRQIAAVQFFETNLNNRAYAGTAKKGVSRLDEIATADGLKVTTSDWMAVDGRYVQGFAKSADEIMPGAEGLVSAAAELDPTSDDLRYAVVSSKRAVWLIEKAETSAAHLPTFDEAKEVVRPRALRAAQEDAFKAEIEAIAKKGTNFVCTTKNVTTNFTFAICDLKRGDFPDQGAIAGAVRKLAAGEVSAFTPTGYRTGLLVVCTARKPGDAAQATLLSSQIRESVAQLQRGQLPEAWQKWNLARIGFEPSDNFSVVESTESEE